MEKLPSLHHRTIRKAVARGVTIATVASVTPIEQLQLTPLRLTALQLTALQLKALQLTALQLTAL